MNAVRLNRTATIAALVTFVLHLAANPHYGFFRDELYFIICGFHPAWGYVDQPPAVPLLAAGSQLFGHSLFLLRALPAIFAAGGVYVTCLLVAELGGGIFATVLASLAFFAAPVLLSFGQKVGPDMVGMWLWPLAALYVLRIVKGADPRWWLAAGACIGVALESKYSYVVNIFQNNVEEYRSGQGDPFQTVTQALDHPEGVTVDKKGTLYVSNVGNSTVVEFALGSLTPLKRQISKGLYEPEGIAYYPALLP